MSIKNKKEGSFYRILAWNYFVFTLFVLLVFWGIYEAFSLFAARIAFLPDIGGFLEKIEKTREEELPSIKAERYLGEGCRIEILDEKGQELFSRGTGAKEGGYGPEELDCIPEYLSDTYFLTAELPERAGDGNSIVTGLKYLENGETAITGYLLLDKERNVVSGGLFPGRSSFSETEFLYLKGTDEDGRKILKDSYASPEGENRIVILHFTEPSYETYLRVYEAWDYLWWFFVPAYLGIAVCCIYFLNKKTKKLLSPFNQAIVNFSKGIPGGLENYCGPKELAEIAGNFTDMESKLKKSSEERRRLLADISHDLKTPITVIQGYAAALKDKMVPPGEEESYLTAIVKRSEKVNELLQAFYEYSKVDHPEMRPRLKREDLCQVCRDYLAERYQELETGGYLLDVDLPEEPVYCLLDKALFCRVLDNLINNSTIYGGSGITIFVSLWREDRKILLSLGDNGKGIPEELADKLFQPFVTGDDSRGSGHGTGLGLAIAKQIILLHNGRIDLAQPPQEGYSIQFIIALPGDGS